MPAKSQAQLKWVNSPAGHKALGEKGVKEWNQSTKGRKLPMRVKGKNHPMEMLRKGMQGLK